MADDIRAEPADILASGTKVGGHAEDVHATHTASDARIESALTGWTGASQAAMATKAARWQVTSRTLSQRLFEHAEGLTSSGLNYERTEIDNVESLNQLGEQARSQAV